MQASYFGSFPSPPIAGGDHRRKIRTTTTFVCCSSNRDAHGRRDYGGRLVDENMIELRRRIHEMKLAEKNYEAPAGWMEWEKRYYVNYGSDVTQLMALLQTLLMNTRPGLGVGIVLLVALSLPASMAFVLFHLVQMASHLCS